MANNIYLLYGTDRFCIKDTTSKILRTQNILFESAELYDMEEVLLEEAMNAAQTIPFLEDQKAVVLQNAFFLSNEKTTKDQNQDIDSLLLYLRNPNPTTTLIIQVPSEKLDTRKNIVKMLMDVAKVEMCQKEETEELYQFVKAKIKEASKQIDPSALQLFISRTSFDKMFMKNELEKLLLYTYEIDKIEMNHVRDVVSRNLEDNIYQLVNALLANEQAQMMQIYYDLLKINTEPVWMMGVIIAKFQEILYTKELLKTKATQEEIMKFFNASKGRVYYIMKNAKEVPYQSVLTYLSLLEQLDYQIKSGQIDKKMGLELFLLKSMTTE